jgi:hypothetical protein
MSPGMRACLTIVGFDKLIAYEAANPRTGEPAVLDVLWIACVGVIIVGTLIQDARRKARRAALTPVIEAEPRPILTMGDVLCEDRV